MKYSSPKIPEGINTVEENPLKEFVILSTGIFALILIAVFILGLFAERLAVYVPFKVEQNLAKKILTQKNQDTESETNIQIQEYIQSLSNKLAIQMELPEEMEITVHYLEDDTVNAFATLGGHIFIYQGLLNELHNENALAMVIAHEIAHIYHRHPIIAMGRGVVIGLLLSAISGASSDSFIIEKPSMITLLNFNRSQEKAADITAFAAINGLYGHVGGGNDFFKTLLMQTNREEPPVFLSTHPLTQDRIDYLIQYTQEKNWNTDIELTPMPKNLDLGNPM